MKDKNKNKIKTTESLDTEKKTSTDGYPFYPISEDIYNRNKEEEDIDPEDLSKLKQPNQNEESGNSLDIPGADLDDNEEVIGSEDEENNYYSIGGDEHNDLDEDNGEETEELRKQSILPPTLSTPSQTDPTP